MNKLKKAGAFGIITWAVGSIIVVLFLGAYLYMHNEMTETLLAITSSTEQVNISYAVQSVIVPVNSAMVSLHWISFVLLLSLAFAGIIESYYVRSHPVLFFYHVLIIILGVVGSVYIVNYYETLLQSGVLSSTLIGFTASSVLILNLPLWVALIGIIGLIVMGIAANRDPEHRGISL